MNQILIDKIYRHAASLPADLALKVLNFAPVEMALRRSYERAREEHKRNLPRLSVADENIVEDLTRQGVCMTSLDKLALPATDEMLSSAQAVVGFCASRAKTSASQAPDTIMADAAELMRHRQIFLWGVNQRLLQIVECYLGLPVAYDGMNVFYTAADGRQAGTRLWHRDREDRRMVKIAVYVNDVDVNGGPLQIVHRDFTDGKVARGFVYPVLSQEALEQQLHGPMRESDVTTCTGAVGTVIFCDTASHYHRGKPAISHDRGAVFYNYFSRVPRHPFYCERSGLSRAQIAELAMNLSPQQRASVLWRESLPMIARLVPPSLV